jgi:DNA-binding MarR family transcriptional regulator
MASKDAESREAWSYITRMFMSGETHDRFHAACDDIGLPHPGSLKALLMLDSSDPPSMREMAEGMHCDASYVTGLVDALEQRGYVERKVSSTDRRVKLVVLTDAGRAARVRAMGVLGEPPKGLSSLSATEVRTLSRLLRKVADAYPPLT